jgi:membrane-associated protein
VQRHGGAAIFIGRFVPAIRSLVPVLVGISGFGRLRFLLLDALACLLWALTLGAIVAGLGAFW